MPIYEFCNDDTEEIREVFFGMNDEKHYIDENGKEWRRVYSIPQASIDAKIDPFSVNKFVEKTSKADTYGAIIDRSTELSQQRAQSNGGVDPIRQKAEDDYSKKRKGRKYIGQIQS